MAAGSKGRDDLVTAAALVEAPAIGRSLAWVGTGIVAFAVFAATLGRGLP